MASSQWYSPQTSLYTYQGKQYLASELVDMYQSWCMDYPIFSLEDGLAESDWEGWKEMTQHLDDTVCLIGDDLFIYDVRSYCVRY